MDYKSLMGYGKEKEKVVEKPTTSEPKVNKVLESVKEEFGLVNEVGAAPLYRKHIKNIDKQRDQVGREVLKFYELLRKKGLNDAADTLLDNYKNCIVGFGKELKKLVRKLM